MRTLSQSGLRWSSE